MKPIHPMVIAISSPQQPAISLYLTHALVTSIALSDCGESVLSRGVCPLSEKFLADQVRVEVLRKKHPSRCFPSLSLVAGVGLSGRPFEGSLKICLSLEPQMLHEAIFRAIPHHILELPMHCNIKRPESQAWPRDGSSRSVDRPVRSINAGISATAHTAAAISAISTVTRAATCGTASAIR